MIIKDVMVTGLADVDIQKEVLGWESLNEKNVNETIGFIEAKEMTLIKDLKKPSGKITCTISNKSTDKFVLISKNKRYIECYACKQCWRKSCKKVYQSHNKYADALLVGGLYTQNFDKLCSRCLRKNIL